MISSFVISQLIDEKKPKELGAAVPGLCVGAQPATWPGRRPPARRSGVAINRAFVFLPGQLGPQTPPGVQGPETKLTPREEKPHSSPQKGFASITITARRVGPPARTLVWGAAGDPLCPRCRAQDPLPRDPPALASGADLCRHHGPFACTEPSGSSPGMRLKLPEAHARLCDGHRYWMASVDHGGDRPSAGTPGSGKSPLLFSSCVHLRVSRPCPKAIYCLDRSLSVPMEPTQPAGPKVHRSVLSLNLNCSSHRLTPDGADGPANGGPISRALEQQLAEGGSGLLGPPWIPATHPPLGQVHVGTATCAWSGSPPSESTELAAAGTQQITVREGKGDHGTRHTSVHANQLSIHIPGWSYRAGDYTCCDLVVQIKACKTGEASAAPMPAPTPPEPTPCEEPETPDLQDSSKGQAAPALTLQEALEARKPQFISRSQERLRKLELVVQQRRAQRRESPGPQQGPLPARARRKQFTVPHPLSDNLFKPKERRISEKEMYMRSKRIYNNLPEVRKKKEEQKKRALLQGNRLRAEVFKKQLLDQLLQRNAV